MRRLDWLCTGCTVPSGVISWGGLDLPVHSPLPSSSPLPAMGTGLVLLPLLLLPFCMAVDDHYAFPLVVGHRGCCAYNTPALYPENTVPAFQYAASLRGVMGIESDLRFSKDGVVVLVHDPTLDRTTNCTGPVVDKTLSELRACDAGVKLDPKFAGTPVPTLEEALQVVQAHDLTMLLDLKVPGLASSVKSILEKYHLEQNVVLGVRFEEDFADFLSLLPTTPMGFIGSPPGDAHDVTFFQDALKKQIRSLVFAQSKTVPAFVMEAHRHGMQLWTWSVDTQEDLADALRDGHDTFITSNPGLAQDAIAKTRKQCKFDQVEWPMLRGVCTQ
eukprot:TRINITY_DN15692_c0_g1_i1.p2 TRINITY_DN15692_c0_g1~~TRINITY_DN15692_c0_g1_i1.p2  ORF type:complete len:330 (+),score=55.19 TRINITY_DN15692_c0_g1_i1:272-1261(+)